MKIQFVYHFKDGMDFLSDPYDFEDGLTKLEGDFLQSVLVGLKCNATINLKNHGIARKYDEITSIELKIIR